MALAAIIIGVIVALGLVAFAVGGFFGEVEARVGRELTFLELVIVVICFPYSLLLLLILAAAPISKSQKAKD